ncbi:MAG: SulP family inorganic anion transporter [Armatimonadaceae bacterium]
MARSMSGVQTDAGNTGRDNPPVPEEGGGFVQTLLRRDLPASLVVFLIAIPLSLGIALASGAPIMGGLIAAVVGGIVAGVLGGSALQVSGPAAGLTVIVFGIIDQFGWPTTCAIVAMAGLVQLALGALRIARGALAISPAVVHGMLAGIGITIVLSQLHVILGGKPQPEALENLRKLPGQISDLHGGATFLGLITIGILFTWRFLPKAIQSVPGPLAAVVLATLISLFTPLGAGVQRVDLPDDLYNDHVLPQFPTGDFGAVAIAVITIALIASIESLLSAVAVDKLHNGPRANLDRELIGQGAANTVSGLLGGLPVTGVIVRSSANVAAGAKTRASAILHGLWVLLFVALLGGLIEQIPNAVLAGLLVYVGVQLVKPHDIRELASHREDIIYWVTVLGVVGMDLLKGVLLGIGLAVVLLLRRLALLKITKNHSEDGKRWHVKVEGSLTFLSVPSLNSALSTIPPDASVDVDLNVDFMDHAAFEALHNWRLGQERTGGKVDIDELHEAWYASAADGKPRKDKSSRMGGIGTIFASVLTGKPRRLMESTGNVTSGKHPQFEDRTSSEVIAGIREFQRSGARMVRPALAELVRSGQKPHDLFIACSDSHVVPQIFTLSGPGDLLKVRNLGNLIPAHDTSQNTVAPDPSVAAAVEYAVNVLQTPGIVVCGHSGCGAMQALLSGDNLSTQNPYLASWLENGRTSLERLRRGEAPDPSLPEVDQLSQVNVLQQIDNLLTYPSVRRAFDDGTLEITGMYFDVESAEVFLLNPQTRKFEPITETEVAEVVVHHDEKLAAPLSR